ncbi:MAG: hypothetical protein IJN04_04685 [Clostridia bacterium]|nr:hypothetical protein [Clostridia bacterium]
MKRIMVIGLCLVWMLAMLPVWSAADAEPVATAAAQPMSVTELQEKYPHGTYWNHTKGGQEDYTTTPCSHHTGNCTYNGSCGCNSYKNVAIQCMGFAYQLASLAYACDSRAEWSTYRDTSALDTLKAGDIVRYNYNGHSIFVTGVEGDTVTYADCNGDGHCKIQWNRTTTKAKLRSGFTYVKTAPYELPQPPETGLALTASAATARVGEKITLTLTYTAADKGIGGVIGTLTYDAARFSFVSASGDGVEVSAADGRARFVYCAETEKASETVTFTVTFAATAYGGGTFTVATEEWIEDGNYASLGLPTAQVKVTVPAPTLTVTCHGGGGAIHREAVQYTYRVLSDNGINMRKDAGTSNGKVSALPYHTVFTVAAGDTKDADGYTWGKTTYNGKTGWVVISHYVEKIGTTWNRDQMLKNGVVCGADGKPLTYAATYGQPMAAPPDPADWGLSKEEYRFAGWNTAADGSGVFAVKGMTPEQICPDGATAVTLYATWVPLVPPGDADGNGRVNNRDLGLLLRHLNGWDVEMTAAADVNGDGAVNNIDLGLLQRMLNEETGV